MSRMDNLRQEKILILDFGGQYKQLIGRRVREAKSNRVRHRWKQLRPVNMRASF